MDTAAELNVSSVGDCSGHAVLDRLRLLPSKGRAEDLRGSVLQDQESMVARTRPIVGADVALICGTGVTCGVTRTDSKGEFTFRDLSPGDFTVHVNGAGFYSLDEPGYTNPGGDRIELLAGVYIERCPKGNCGQRAAPRRRPVRCE